MVPVDNLCGRPCCKLSSAVVLVLGVFTFAASAANAQSTDSIVPVSAESNHRIRFDNGKVRMYDVQLSKGNVTAFHEHTKDSFSVIMATTTRVNQPQNGERVDGPVKAGQVGYAPTAKGPYTHRIEATGETPYRVIAMELLSDGKLGTGITDSRRSPPFAVAVQDNPRGRAYRVTLKPGESTGTFERPANTAIFAISGGRISELTDGQAPRLWDLEAGRFRWTEQSQKLTMRNEGTTDVEIVEIEVF